MNFKNNNHYLYFPGLEGDMYQLSHLLSEQKSLLTTLASTSIFQHQELLPLNEAEINKEEEDNVELKRKQILSDIAEKIEGCIVSDQPKNGSFTLLI